MSNRRFFVLFYMLTLLLVTAPAWAQEAASDAFGETTPPQWQVPLEEDTAAQEPLPTQKETRPQESSPAQADDPFLNALQETYKEDTTKKETGDGETTPSLKENSVKRLLPAFSDTILRTVAILFLLCGVLILGSFLIRKFGKRSALLSGQSLATVLGKVHLSPKACLFFVKTGDRILVVGLTQQNMRLITEFSADAFEAERNTESISDNRDATAASDGFFAQLHATATAPSPLSSGSEAGAPSEDDELNALRGDIQRLQQFLQDGGRDQKR